MPIDYYKLDASPRNWDHLAMISTDGGQPGLFDPEESILHMGYLYGLTEVPAREQGRPSVVQFLRFKPQILRQLAATRQQGRSAL